MLGVLAGASGCRSSRQADRDAPAAPARPLAWLPGQVVLVAPLQLVQADSGWAAAGHESVRQRADSAIEAALSARDVGAAWVYAAGLQRSYQRNRAYATDPRALAVRGYATRKPAAGDRLAEALAAQLRTMIALHEGRVVLIPVALRLVAVPGDSVRAELQVVVADGRTADVRWAGEVALGTVTGFTPEFFRTLGLRVADLVSAP
jgi:hypothetical protein